VVRFFVHVDVMSRFGFPAVAPSYPLVGCDAMPRYADIYVLTPLRTKATVRAFLDRFLPERAETADEYWIPQHFDVPHTVLHTAAEVISYCCGRPSETQSIYWRRVAGGSEDPAYAIIIFTADGHLILGLSTEEYLAQRYFADLRRHSGSEIGYITVGSPPPQTAADESAGWGARHDRIGGCPRTRPPCRRTDETLHRGSAPALWSLVSREGKSFRRLVAWALFPVYFRHGRLA